MKKDIQKKRKEKTAGETKKLRKKEILNTCVSVTSAVGLRV